MANGEKQEFERTRMKWIAYISKERFTKKNAEIVANIMLGNIGANKAMLSDVDHDDGKVASLNVANDDTNYINNKVIAIIYGEHLPLLIKSNGETIDYENESQDLAKREASVVFGSNEYWNGLFVQYNLNKLVSFIPLSSHCFGYVAACDEFVLNSTDWKRRKSYFFEANPREHIIGLKKDPKTNKIINIITARIKNAEIAA